MQRKTSSKQDLEIIALYSAATPTRDICARYSISYPVLDRLLARNNITRRRQMKFLTDEEKLEVAEFCLSGNKSHEAAEHFGISSEQVFKILKRESLRLPRGSRSVDPNHVSIPPGTVLTPDEAKQRRRDNHAKWAAAHPEEMKQYIRDYRIRNLETQRERVNKYQRNVKYWRRPSKIKSRRAWMKIHLEVPTNRLHLLVYNIERRCERKKIKFDKELYALADQPPVTCLCCGSTIDYSGPRGFSRNPSFDRLRANDGYTVSNTRIICLRCNMLKNNASLDELRLLATYVERELAQNKTSDVPQ